MSLAGAFTSLYEFKGGQDGAEPMSGLTLGGDGAFYGTTWEGGKQNYGVAYKVFVVPGTPGPDIAPGSGMYTYGTSVALTDGIPSATIYYTTDGSTPSKNSTVYSTPIVLTQNMTINAMASADGYDSPVLSAQYAVQPGPPPEPVFGPAAGEYFFGTTVVLTDGVPSATIYYTTDGSTPTKNSSVYTAPIVLTRNDKFAIKAMASANSYDSRVSSALYYVMVAEPAIKKKKVSNGVLVALSDSTPGAIIRYTLDGTNPNDTAPVYRKPFVLTETTRVSAIGTVPSRLPGKLMDSPIIGETISIR